MPDTAASPAVLILGSRFDFTCDYVVSALRRRGVEYLRLNSEDLPGYSVTLDPVAPRLTVDLNRTQFCVAPTSLRSVLFRRPVFVRDYGDDQRRPQDRFARIQWAAFMQNLALLDGARWYNNPASTYRAEHKALQLREAARIGMRVPATLVTNVPSHASACLPGQQYAVKGLDTVMVRESGDEIFGFTTFASRADLEDPAWASAPTLLQEVILHKTDVRVTIVEDRVFAAEVLVAGKGVSDDWRLHRGHTCFVRHDLPNEVSRLCVELVAALGLRCGAIDLALSGEAYYFLEVNPTGEWAWLVDAAGLPIDEAFADALSR